MAGLKETEFSGRMVIAGFGSIGQGVLPLLLRHIGMRPEQITIVKPSESHLDAARRYGVHWVQAGLDRGNYRDVLTPLLGKGDFLLNLSVEVGSLALIDLCRERGALYLDTCNEPWPQADEGASTPPAERTNYVLREAALEWRRRKGTGPTAVLTHGANPGLVSHFVKQALIDLAADGGMPTDPPRSREGWALLAQQLGVRVIHVSERDSQICDERRQPGEFVNTWSIKGFVDEALQPAELGWGSHERHFPVDGHAHARGSLAAIYLDRPGASQRVRSWAPIAGGFHGFLITHAESISIADYLTVGSGSQPEYRPTVHYVYHPCDDAVLSIHDLAGRNWRLQERSRLIRDEITLGRDELGVLLMGHRRGAYWYGSQLTIQEARDACPCNSATSLQVTAPAMAGVVWALRNPDRGLVEPEELAYDDILRLCRPYLGTVVGVYSDWTPLADRERLFKENLDRRDPWQFKNFRVD
jgi:homospermidine synthase